MPNGMIITIPGGKELKIGLLKNVIRKAALTDLTWRPTAQFMDHKVSSFFFY
jgi:hypothetical protein